MKKKIILTVILIATLFAFSFFIHTRFYDEQKNILKSYDEIYKTTCGIYEKGEVKVGLNEISVDIANNDCKRELGLSGKVSLNDNGMMFVFEDIGNHGFWMKNMNFPIDILWINDNFEVVGIEKNIYPDTYPKSFGEKYLAKYVLEIIAGYSEKNNIKVGDKIIYENCTNKNECQRKL